MATAKKTPIKKTAVKKVAVKKTAKASDNVGVVKKTAEELLANMEVSATVEVVEVDDAFQVKVETEESGLLIGYHGETLSSFQLILGLIVNKNLSFHSRTLEAGATKKLGEWTRVVVEVGDYRAKREAQLMEMANSYAVQVIASGQPMVLPYLPPIERRIIHLTLQDRTDVETVSEGEGNERRVVVKPK